MTFSVADKLRIAERLDAFGVHYIEGGWPGSNPKDIEFFEQAKHRTFQRARLAAFGSTRRKDIARRRRRPGAAAARRRHAGRHDLRQDLAAARPRSPADDAGREPGDDRGHGPLPEGSTASSSSTTPSTPSTAARTIREYALATWQAAERGGADIVVLCDTNGGSLPARDRRDHARTRARSLRRRLGIHTHDDIGLGVANALAAHRGRRHARAGHDQRLRRADRQLQPDERDADPAVQAEEVVGARRVAAAAARSCRSSSTRRRTSGRIRACRGSARPRSRTRAART